MLTIALLRLAATGEAAAGEVKEPSNPVIPDVSEVVWAAICFFLLLLLVYTVLMPTLRRLMAERDAKIRGDRDSAERTRDALGVVKRDYDAALADARAEANRLIEAARAEADAHRQSLQTVADQEIGVLRQAAQQQSEHKNCPRPMYSRIGFCTNKRNTTASTSHDTALPILSISDSMALPKRSSLVGGTWYLLLMRNENKMVKL